MRDARAQGRGHTRGKRATRGTRDGVIGVGDGMDVAGASGRRQRLPHADHLGGIVAAAAADGRLERVGPRIDFHRIGAHQQHRVRQHDMALAFRVLHRRRRTAPVLGGTRNLARIVGRPQARL